MIIDRDMSLARYNTCGSSTRNAVTSLRHSSEWFGTDNFFFLRCLLAEDGVDMQHSWTTIVVLDKSNLGKREEKISKSDAHKLYSSQKIALSPGPPLTALIRRETAQPTTSANGLLQRHCAIPSQSRSVFNDLSNHIKGLETAAFTSESL